MVLQACFKEKRRMKYLVLAIKHLIFPFLVLAAACAVAFSSLEPYIGSDFKNLIYLIPTILSISFFLISIQKDRRGEATSLFADANTNISKELKRAMYPAIPANLLYKKPSGIVLGKQGSKYICIPLKSDGVNAFVVGTPGAGKSVMLKNIIVSNFTKQSLFNFFLIDIDGLIYKDLLPDRGCYEADWEEHIKVVDIPNRSSYGWDVFYQLREENLSETKKLKVVTDISEALIEVTKENPYFSDNARKILTGVLLWGIEKGMDFVPIIQRLMRTTLSDLLDEIVGDAEANGWGIILDKIKSFVGKGENESIQDVEATLKQKLDVFSYPDIEYAFRTNPNRTSPKVLDDACTSLVFAPPTEMLLAYAPVFRLITMQVLRHCETAFPVSDERRTCIFIDEASRIGLVEGLADLMATGRKYGNNIFLFYQDLSQFRDIYGKEKAATIANLSELKLFLSGSGDKDTTDYLASMVGDYMTTSTSYEKSRLFGLQVSNKYSEEHRPIIDGQTMMQLRSKGELIAIYFGNYYRLKKVFYFNDKKLKRLSESLKK